MASRLHQIPNEIDDIVIGVLRGVRGVQGELRIDVLTDVPERFQPGRFVSIKGLKRKITKFTVSSKGGLSRSSQQFPNRRKSAVKLDKHASVLPSWKIRRS